MPTGHEPSPTANARASSVEADGWTVARKPVPRWLVWGSRIFGAGVAAFLLSLAAVVVFGLEGNPLIGGFVLNRIVLALQERIDPSLTLSIDSVELNRGAAGTVVRVNGFTVRDASGRALVAAPTGSVTLDTMSLAALRLTPKEIVLQDLHVAVDISETGAVSVASAPAAPIPPNAPAQQGNPAEYAGPPLERMQQLIGAAFAGLSATRDAVGGRLPALGVVNASLEIQDQRTRRHFSITGINCKVVTARDGAAQARVDLKTGASPWAVLLEVSPRSAEGQSFVARSEGLRLSDLMDLAGARLPDIDGGAAVSMTVSAHVDPAQRAKSARAELGVRDTKVTISGAKPYILPIDEIQASVTWSDGAEGASIEALNVVSGTTKIALAGDARPPARADEPWLVSLNGVNQQLDGLKKGDKPVQLASIALQLAAFPEQARLSLTRLAVQGPNAQLRLNGEMTLGPDGRPAMTLELAAADTEARVALRLWPPFVAPELRVWLVDHVKAGQLNQLGLKANFTAQGLADALSDRPIPDESLRVSWNVSRAVLQPVDGTPPIRDAVASGQATGRTARLDVTSGHVDLGGNRRLALTDGSFIVTDTARKPVDARVRFRFSGGADALAELIRSPGLQAHTSADVDPATLKGTVEGEAQIALRLADKMGPNDVRLGMNASLKGMTIDKAIAGDKIEAGNFQLTVDRDNLLLKGDGKIFGASANIEVRSVGKAKPRASIAMVLDDATRTRKGFALGGVVTGPVGLKISTDLDAPDDRDISIELDLVRAKLEGVVPGWLKPAGQAAKAKATLSTTDAGGWLLDGIEFDAGTVSVRGSAQLAADGQFQKAQLPVFKLSPGDVAHLDIERVGGVLKLNIKGNSVDARPFLKSLQTGTIDKSGAKDTEIALRSTALAGYNGEIVANADLKLTLRGSEMRRFDLTGNFDNGVIAARLAVRPGSQPTLLVDSEDAGAFLRFFDIYNRMQGGQLTLGAALGSGSQTGTILIKDFVLRNEPAMKRLVADAQFAAGDGTRLDPAFVQRLSANQDVKFTKMTVEFARNSARLELKDAVIWGSEIGGSMAGILDYARDRVDLTGTFVPAYTLNNFFAQVPLLGPILGGGRNEGLFAVRYNITGRVSGPTLSINPLTVIAPGFLRRLIDFRGAPGSSAPRSLPSGSDR